jgi:hypothetical protein
MKRGVAGIVAEQEIVCAGQVEGQVAEASVLGGGMEGGGAGGIARSELFE